MSLRSKYEDLPSEEIYRRGQELGFYDSTYLRSPPPSYDPILTPIFTAMLGTGGLGFGMTAAANIAGALTAISMTSVTGSVYLGGRPK